MKKFLLLLLVGSVLFGGEAFAQRRTAQYDTSVGIYDGVCTYSYIVRNGYEIYDGPVSIKSKQTIVDRNYYGVITCTSSMDYSLTGNNTNGYLNGPVKMKKVFKNAPRGSAEYMTNSTFSGNFTNGLPNGRFLFTEKEVENGRSKQIVNIDITYTKGMFTGPFTLVYNGYICTKGYIKGAFTSDGLVTGKWEINDYSCEFKNGVLIGGDMMTSDPTVVELTKKFANNQITLEQLNAEGWTVKMYNLPGLNGRDLYEYTADVLGWSLLKFNETGFDSKSYYDKEESTFYMELEKLPTFSDSEFEKYFNAAKRKLGSLAYIDGIEAFGYRDKSLGAFGGKDSNGDFCCFTKAQTERLNKAVEEHNNAVDEKRKSLIYQKIYNTLVQIDGSYFKVVSHSVLQEYSREKGVVLELNCRPQNSSSQAYSTYTAEVSCNDNSTLNFASITRIRNKYDDIEDAKAAFNKEAENQLNTVAALIKEKQATNFSGVATQLSIFRNYVAQVNRAQINHNNLDATIKLFNDHAETSKSFSVFMPLYIEACKGDVKVKQTHVSKYTSTTAPVLISWSKSAKVENLSNAIAAQQEILKLWESFAPLKDEVVKNHNQISSNSDPILAQYKSEYGSLVGKKISLEKSIEAYTKFIEHQKEVAEQLKTYDTLKTQAADNHKQIGESEDGVLSEYRSMYNTTLNVKSSLSEGIAAYNKLIEKQKVVAEQWKNYNDLKAQIAEVHKQICDSKSMVVAEYHTLYEANSQPQNSLEEAIATYKNFLVVQKTACDYIPLYNKAIENNTALASAIKPAKCAAKAYKLYYKGLDLNWKREGALEKINKILENQNSLLAISKRPTLKADEKRVKKLKLTNLEDIIKAYLN